MRTNRRLATRLAAGFAALVMGVTAALVTPTPAQAVTTSSPCGWYYMCYWWGANYGGAQTGVYDQYVYDLADPPVHFYGGGYGSGERLWDNAASGANYDPGWCVGLFYYPGYGTPALYLSAYGWGLWWSSSLWPVTNNNRSQWFYYC